MRYIAKHRFADSSARKIRPFGRMIRGMSAEEALEQLRFYHNKAARLLEQVLKSALGNAEDRGAVDIEELTVAEVRIDDGPIIKRWRPRARGAAFPIRKRLCHIFVAVEEEKQEQVVAAASATETAEQGAE